MRRTILAAAVVGALAACSGTPAPEVTVTPACKAAVTNLMRDPGSVTFDDLVGPSPLEPPHKGWGIIGTYRARNGFGGMNTDTFICTTDEQGAIVDLVTGESLDD